MLSSVKFTTAIPTIATLAGVLSAPAIDNQEIYIQHLPETEQILNLAEIYGNMQTHYRVIDENADSISKIEAIHKFSSNLLQNIEDLDPEFSKAIDENYWDLI